MKIKIVINEGLCIGCGVCEVNEPDHFIVDPVTGISKADDSMEVTDISHMESIAQMCPVKAITLYDEAGNKIYPRD